MKQITLYIRDDQHEKLQAEKNQSEIVRQGLDLYYQKGDDNMEIIDKLEQAGYSRVERTTRDDYWTKVWQAEEYCDLPAEEVSYVLSRVYPERQLAEYINLEEGTPEEIVNANKIHEDDYHELVSSLENNSKGDDNMEFVAANCDGLMNDVVCFENYCGYVGEDVDEAGIWESDDGYYVVVPETAVDYAQFEPTGDSLVAFEVPEGDYNELSE